MNTNFASWKLLEKKLTDWIKNHEGITNELSKISIDWSKWVDEDEVADAPAIAEDQM